MRLTILLLSFLLAMARQAVACSCLKAPSVGENWAAAGQVFVGVVERADTSGHYSSSGARVTLFTVRVLESFKQEVNEARPLRTFVSAGEAACDSYFRVGERYLVYAYGTSGGELLKSSACHRTALLEDAEKGELEELRRMHRDSVSYSTRNDAAEYELGLLRASRNRLGEKLDQAEIALSVSVICLAVLVLLLLQRRGRLGRHG